MRILVATESPKKSRPTDARPMVELNKQVPIQSPEWTSCLLNRSFNSTGEV